VNRFEAELARVREERKEAKKLEILKQLTEKRRKEQLAKGGILDIRQDFSVATHVGLVLSFH
jgi:hypothetical protein